MRVKVHFRTATSPAEYDLIRGPYEKGSYTCFTLVELGPDGGHVIKRHVTETIWMIDDEHRPHAGSSLEPK